MACKRFREGKERGEDSRSHGRRPRVILPPVMFGSRARARTRLPNTSVITVWRDGGDGITRISRDIKRGVTDKKKNGSREASIDQQ